jgi:RNA polymerase sigma-70 factor (ECF subfamily)
MDTSARDNQEAFIRLYVANEESLRAYVRSLVPSLDDAREVMQEIAAILWRKFNPLDPPDHFRRWAFGVARLEALAHRRSISRDRHVFSEETINLLAASAEELTDTLEKERIALRDCVSRLPSAKRSLLEAAYAPAARIDHLAIETGRTPMSLYKALHRIRLELLECTRRFLARGDAT